MRKSIAIALLGIMLAGTIPAGHPQGGGFVITRNTIDGGGGTSAAGNFVLIGSIGQPDASEQPSVGGDYALAGGFWAQITGFVAELIFENGFE